MEIQKVDIDKLKPLPFNPKIHPESQIDRIIKSLNEFGFTNPILATKDNYIMAGHGRIEAARKAGIKKVPVIYFDFDLNKAKAYNIADNRLAELAEDDIPKLKDMLQELDTGDLDMEAIGYSENELEELMTQFYEPDEKDDVVPEVPEEPITKLGDLYQLGEHRLLCGDATKKEDVERLMDGNKADMVFTDPPYNALKSWDKDEAKSECRLDPSKWFKNDNMDWDDYRDFLLGSFSGFTGHSIYVCCDFRIYSLIVEAIIKNGWDLKHCIVWVKNVWGLGKRYRFQHEFIVYASKKDAPFFGDRSQSDVWNIDVDRSDEHNTPKPVCLSVKAIKNSSQIKNIVLDLFGGSGSTLIACEKMNRRCYICEIDPYYCDVIVKRWEDYTSKKAEMILNEINS